MRLGVLLRMVELPLGNLVLSSYQAVERDNRGNRRASLVTLAFLWKKGVFFFSRKRMPRSMDHSIWRSLALT
jgi:hypothetical protein